VLAACGGNENDQSINPAGINPARRGGYDEVFGTNEKFAAVAADESRAAEVGRAVLASGGNATDAAVAMYFAMAVTLPSAAGLGASGACVIQDSKSLGSEAFVFAPQAAPGPIRGATFTVPTGPRAMALMHVRHGVARWEMDVAPAEKLARFGFPVSQALARDLRAAQLDGEARRVLTRNGAPLGENDTLVENDLAATLSIIRRGGAGEFFSGSLARMMSEGVSQLGGSLPVEALRGAIPQSGPPLAESYYGYKLYTAPSPAGGANVIAAWKGASSSASTGSSGDSGGYAGFAAGDEKGGAAACSLSMGQLFGSRQMVPGTGVILGGMGDIGGISPLVLGNPNNSEYKFAGAGGGSPSSAFAVGAVARATLRDDRKLGAALAARAGQGGFVSAIVCPDGKSKGQTCQAGVDPAGSGMAATADR
jgi:gamma-glutamyltranspeptidase/glutathione hydrolase